jgi:hypothetical protein
MTYRIEDRAYSNSDSSEASRRGDTKTGDEIEVVRPEAREF